MKNILTVVRRDLSAYFTSPIGYIFMIVFLLMSVGLYITSFFTFPVADMRAFFGNLPVLLCVFIPAVTMRVWAEERKENTWELLLTFPMKAHELVLGKFLAVFAFYAMSTAATATVPVMLAALGNPDSGAILCGYLGTLLLGAFFLAIGIFFSGLCKDQIVAFVVSLLACFAVFLLGTNFIASYLDGLFSEKSWLAGLGTTLGELVGVIEHYNSFTRGVIDIADVLYFVVWTALFLVLNGLYIDSRNRRGAKMAIGTAAALCIGIGLAFNWLILKQSFGRFDMTEDKIFTVSPASKAILSRLDTPVQVKLYITRKDKMPTGMNTLEQDVSDKLNELRLASGGNVEFTPVYLDVGNLAPEKEAREEKSGKPTKEEEVESLEKRMLDKGIEPFAVRAMERDQVTTKYIYSSLGIGYKDKQEEIIPQVMPETLPALEYRLVSTVFKLTRAKAPVVALVAPKEAINISPEMRAIYAQLGQPVPQTEDPFEYVEQALRLEKYMVERVELTKESPMPKEYDVLVVMNPRQLNDRQRWEINRALVEGKSVVLAVQNYYWDYQTTRSGLNLMKQEQQPDINPLLEKYGLGINDDILMDKNKLPLTVQSRGGSLQEMLMGQTVNIPIQMLVTSSSMDPETSITNRLANVFYIWGSALKLNEEDLKKHGLTAKVVMKTSASAWTVPADAPPADLQRAFTSPPADTEQYPLMAMVSGQFPDAYKDQPRPKWPAPRQMPGQPPAPDTSNEPEAEPATPAPGKLALLGCAQMFTKSFLRDSNLDLFMNTVDAAALGDELVNVRGQKQIDRAIDRPSDATRTLWKTINYGLMPIIIAVIGIGVVAVRRQSRNAYTLSFTEKS
ncbi:MAG TPA: Gldg family protein [Candidatus Hydrogenedentes bacterium]|nr:Gldg family protein [Candidatus Hydrogenedentota bacterium]HOS02555.1 Gldg family protein [Candidatus Hydrogenedentota bacterium]